MALFQANKKFDEILIKGINKTFTNITFNANGEAAITPPSVPSGYLFLGSAVVAYNGFTKGAVSVIGNYLQGTPNQTIGSVTVRFTYIKSEYFNLTTD